MASSVAAVAPTIDPRRISESDADFQRVRSYWLRRLMASLRTLVRDIRTQPQHIAAAQSAFIHRHTALLQQAYLAAHQQGQLDYWEAVSLHPQRWRKARPMAPQVSQVQRRLMFYAAASVTKIAREAEVAYNQDRSHATKPTKSSSSPRSSSTQLADPPTDLAFDKFAAWASPRVGLQVDITWSGFQDGYLDAATADAAGLQLQLWWELEPDAQHCDDCPAMADGSPYDAPGSGGNELDQTPGDGGTQCGAACKCSLRYGWSDLRAAGMGQPGDNELIIPSSGIDLNGLGTLQAGAQQPQPTEWDRQRQAAIDRATGGNGQSTARLPGQPPVTPGQTGVSGLPIQGGWDQAREDAIAQADALGRPIWPPNVQPGQPLSPIESLTDGQKGLLDGLRTLGEQWDAVRGGLPDFETYFDPDSPHNMWSIAHQDVLNAQQHAMVQRFLRLMQQWDDESLFPMDGTDNPQQPQQ